MIINHSTSTLKLLIESLKENFCDLIWKFWGLEICFQSFVECQRCLSADSSPCILWMHA